MCSAEIDVLSPWKLLQWPTHLSTLHGPSRSHCFTAPTASSHFLLSQGLFLGFGGREPHRSPSISGLSGDKVKGAWLRGRSGKPAGWPLNTCCRFPQRVWSTRGTCPAQEKALLSGPHHPAICHSIHLLSPRNTHPRQLKW